MRQKTAAGALPALNTAAAPFPALRSIYLGGAIQGVKAQIAREKCPPRRCSPVEIRMRYQAVASAGKSSSRAALRPMNLLKYRPLYHCPRQTVAVFHPASEGPIGRAYWLPAPHMRLEKGGRLCCEAHACSLEVAHRTSQPATRKKTAWRQVTERPVRGQGRFPTEHLVSLLRNGLVVALLVRGYDPFCARLTSVRLSLLPTTGAWHLCDRFQRQ